MVLVLDQIRGIAMSWKLKFLFISLAIAFVVVIWLGIHILGYLILGPRPPRPTITRGEFDFRLEYEVHGERFVIEDTIVASFDGFSSDTGVMAWYRTWRLHLASDRRAQHLLLLELDDGRRIYYGLVSPSYLMGDLDIGLTNVVQRERTPNPNWYPFNAPILVPASGSPTGSRSSVGGPEGLYNDFGIRLISWEHDPPITNTFR